MDLRLIRAFILAADHPTFSDAASAASITQPAFTKQIQQLESIAGAPLFWRSHAGSTLTSAGSALLAQARKVVQIADDFDATVRALSRGEAGHLSIGFGLSSVTVAPRAVAVFRSSFPNVSVRLEDMSSHAQIEAVRGGRLDIAFARTPPPHDLCTIPLLSDRLAIVYPEDGKLAPDPRTLDAWLHQHPLIRLSSARGPGLAGQISRYLRGLDVPENTLQEADDLQTVLALVAAGVGASIVPRSAAAVAPAGVAMTTLDGDLASWEVGAIWRPDNHAPAVRSFLHAITTLPDLTDSRGTSRPPA
jgi:DNA-binding transcriptional LysR family regulator